MPENDSTRMMASSLRLDCLAHKIYPASGSSGGQMRIVICVECGRVTIIAIGDLLNRKRVAGPAMALKLACMEEKHKWE